MSRACVVQRFDLAVQRIRGARHQPYAELDTDLRARRRRGFDELYRFTVDTRERQCKSVDAQPARISRRVANAFFVGADCREFERDGFFVNALGQEMLAQNIVNCARQSARAELDAAEAPLSEYTTRSSGEEILSPGASS